MQAPTQPVPPPVPPLSEKARGKLPMGVQVPTSYAVNGTSRPPPSSTRSVRFSTQPQNQVPFTDVHRRARLRLMPLLNIEGELTPRLFPEFVASAPSSTNGTTSPTLPGMREVCVRAGSGWKEVIAAMQKEKRETSGLPPTEELTKVLDACRDDIVSLWEDAAVKDMLKRRSIRLQDMPGL